MANYAEEKGQFLDSRYHSHDEAFEPLPTEVEAETIERIKRLIAENKSALDDLADR